eukprot:1133100-Pleurochrysis_carterae.AAC.1
MLMHVANIRLLSAASCGLLVLIHSYWIIGFRVLGLSEPRKATLVTYPSDVQFQPAFALASIAASNALWSAASATLRASSIALDCDKRLHDIVFDALFDAPRYVSLLRERARCMRMPEPVEPAACRVPTHAPRPIRHDRMSAPIATPARIMIASRPRRNSPRHGRTLRNGARSIGFVVDSGCTRHIHLHVSDLVNVRPCSDLVAGMDGRPQRCTAIGDMPLSALDDKGITVPVTLRDVRIMPSFSDSLLSVNALWEASSTECRFADARSLL